MHDLGTIDRHRYLYLTGITEPRDNSLLLRVEEGRVPDVPEGSDGLVGRPIMADEHGAAYDVFFPSYVAYAVRNESFALAHEDEEFAGRIAVTSTRSRFLDFVRAGTFADDVHPGPVTHYCFFCLNHTVDVAAAEPPEVRVVRPGA